MSERYYYHGIALDNNSRQLNGKDLKRYLKKQYDDWLSVHVNKNSSDSEYTDDYCSDFFCDNESNWLSQCIYNLNSMFCGVLFCNP